MKKMRIKGKITNRHSILVQICTVNFFAILIAGVFLMWMYSTNAKDEITTMAKHYINDLAISYGSTLDNEIKKADGDATYVMKADNLYMKLNGVGIEGVESSYVYVLDANGQTVYDPEDSKIGHAPEDAVIQQCVKDWKAGKELESGIVEYEQDGVSKYAGIYVSTYK